MSDTTVTSSLTTQPATLAPGIYLAGTFTATYNSQGALVSVSNVRFEVDDTNTNTISYFTDQTTPAWIYNAGSGTYEIYLQNNYQGIGNFSNLYVAWSGEHPTTLNTTGSVYTSVIQGSTTLAATNGGTVGNMPCYAAGTLIATAEAEVPVEQLSVGQLVATASGDLRPIRWIGHRRIDLTRHPEPHLVQPVRIAAGAIAEGVPARDLVVSPDHGVMVDGLLIPARLLVNHRSITIDADATAVTYYHVELDRHDIIIAEGAPAESYLDTGNRDVFEGGSVTVLNPDMSVAQRLRVTAQGACMALATDAAAVLPIWQRLADRADAPVPVTEAADAGIAIVAGGRTLRPVVEAGDRRIFALPQGTIGVRLVSGAARPSDATPWLDDRRLLGVPVKAVLADQKALPIDGPAFGTGWWDMEGAGATGFRWTNGNAWLEVPAGTKLLTIRLHGAMADDVQADHAKAA